MTKKRKNKHRMPKYRSYIKSKRWHRKREEKLKSVGWKCENCGERHDLHVHHLSYRHLGDEKLDELQVLCEGCHCNEHEDEGFVDPITSRYLEFMSCV